MLGPENLTFSEGRIYTLKNVRTFKGPSRVIQVEEPLKVLKHVLGTGVFSFHLFNPKLLENGVFTCWNSFFLNDTF